MFIRFVTEHAIEEKVLERAAQKLRLDQLVIQQGRAQQAAKAAQSKEELVTMIQHGAWKFLRAKGATGKLGSKTDLTEDDIDEILKHGEERTKELNAGTKSLESMICRNSHQRMHTSGMERILLERSRKT